MSTRELRVDWPECRGRGLCHEVLPELVDLDEWGYPIIRGPVTDALARDAAAAVRACPRRALRLLPGRRPGGPVTWDAP